MLNQLEQQGINITAEMTQQVKERAAAEATLAQNIAAANLQRDIKFERQQLGRSDEEQGIASRLRSAGLDYESPAGKLLADQMRLNNALAQTKELATDAFRGIVSDLRNGVPLADSFSNALDNIVDKMLSMVADRAISGLLNGLIGGGVGGAPGGLLGSLGIPGFAGGRASGGPIPAGSWAVVGERGPEIAMGPSSILPIAGSGGPSVNIQVIEGSGTQTNVTQNEDGSIQIESMIRGMENRLADRMSRGQGNLSKATRGNLSRANLRG
jgi:hypothetical protein